MQGSGVEEEVAVPVSCCLRTIGRDVPSCTILREGWWCMCWDEVRMRGGCRQCCAPPCFLRLRRPTLALKRELMQSGEQRERLI